MNRASAEDQLNWLKKRFISFDMLFPPVEIARNFILCWFPHILWVKSSHDNVSSVQQKTTQLNQTRVENQFKIAPAPSRESSPISRVCVGNASSCEKSSEDATRAHDETSGEKISVVFPHVTRLRGRQRQSCSDGKYLVFSLQDSPQPSSTCLNYKQAIELLPKKREENIFRTHTLGLSKFTRSSSPLPVFLPSSSLRVGRAHVCSRVGECLWNISRVSVYFSIFYFIHTSPSFSSLLSGNTSKRSWTFWGIRILALNGIRRFFKFNSKLNKSIIVRKKRNSKAFFSGRAAEVN